MDSVFDLLLIITGFICIVGGMIGCVVPVIPGLFLCWIGLLCFYAVPGDTVDGLSILTTLFVAVVVTVVEYVLPVKFTQRMGGTKYGQYAALIGLIIGLFFGLIGIIVIPFVFTFGTEWTISRDSTMALRSALGSLIAFLLSTALKLAAAVYFMYLAIAHIVS